jgi:hypothetical protein
MYTRGAVTLRSFALALALLIAATPVIGVVCAMDCHPAPATSSLCHEAAVPHDRVTFRAAPHACDHDQTGGTAALLAIASARDCARISTVATAPTPALAMLPEADAAAADAEHGPPGLGVRMTSFHITVLRI